MKCKYVLSVAFLFGMTGLLGAFINPALLQQEEANASASLEEDSIPHVGQPGVTSPVFTNKVEPVYPRKAKKEKIYGYVIVQAVMHKTGKVGDVKVLRGLGEGQYGFEDAAVAAVSKWKFKPGSFNGKPSDVKISLKLDFYPPSR